MEPNQTLLLLQMIFTRTGATVLDVEHVTFTVAGKFWHFKGVPLQAERTAQGSLWDILGFLLRANGDYDTPLSPCFTVVISSLKQTNGGQPFPSSNANRSTEFLCA